MLVMLVREPIANIQRTVHICVQENPAVIAHEQPAMLPERPFLGLFLATQAATVAGAVLPLPLFRQGGVHDACLIADLGKKARERHTIDLLTCLPAHLLPLPAATAIFALADATQTAHITANIHVVPGDDHGCGFRRQVEGVVNATLVLDALPPFPDRLAFEPAFRTSIGGL